MKPEKNMMKKFIFALLLLALSVHTAFSAEMPDMPRYARYAQYAYDEYSVSDHT